MLRTTACIASLFGALVLATPAVAAKGAGGATKSSSISLAQPAGLAATAAGWPRYGDSVSFDVATAVTTAPWVNLKCEQGGALVAEGWASYALGAPSFGLYSPAWSGGGADCSAWLVDYAGGRWKQLAATAFQVSE